MCQGICKLLGVLVQPCLVAQARCSQISPGQGSSPQLGSACTCTTLGHASLQHMSRLGAERDRKTHLWPVHREGEQHPPQRVPALLAGHKLVAWKRSRQVLQGHSLTCCSGLVKAWGCRQASNAVCCWLLHGLSGQECSSLLVVQQRLCVPAAPTICLQQPLPASCTRSQGSPARSGGRPQSRSPLGASSPGSTPPPACSCEPRRPRPPSTRRASAPPARPDTSSGLE